ncbi:MAG: response regulator [Acidobacteriota bacterium]
MRTPNLESRADGLPFFEGARRPPRIEGPQILVVEDEEPIAAGLTECLEAEGFTVEWLSSGAGVESRILANPPLLLIMDVQLGDANGHAIYCALRAAGCWMPIILMSGSATLTTRELDESSAFLAKPFAVEDLLRTAASLNVFPSATS